MVVGCRLLVVGCWLSVGLYGFLKTVQSKAREAGRKSVSFGFRLKVVGVGCRLMVLGFRLWFIS